MTKHVKTGTFFKLSIRGIHLPTTGGETHNHAPVGRMIKQNNAFIIARLDLRYTNMTPSDASRH